MKRYEAQVTFADDLVTREDLKTELLVLRQSLVVTHMDTIPKQATGDSPWNNQPVTLRVDDAASYVGLSRSSIVELIRDKQLESILLGGRRLVLRQSLDDLVESRRRAAQRGDVLKPDVGAAC